MENKKLRYEDVSKGHHVYIDDDNNIIFAQSEGVAYIQAYSSYTISGEEVMALWGPTQEIYLKVTVTEPEPGEEIFFDYREGEATDAPTISCHVLKNEQIDVDHWLQTCEIAGPYNEDDKPKASNARPRSSGPTGKTGGRLELRMRLPGRMPRISP